MVLKCPNLDQVEHPGGLQKNIYTKKPECVDIIRRISQGFHSWCPGSMSPYDECFQGTS